MRVAQDILFDVTGQTLYYDAPEGRPSSVTSVDVFSWDVGDDQTAESAAGAGSVESDPNTTLDAAAGPSQSNPRNIPLTATTGVAATRTYLVTGAAGLKEWVEVDSVTSADSVTAKHPLHNDYAIGATFQTTRIQATVDPTWVADTANLSTSIEMSGNPMYRVRWVYVVSGKTYVADTYFNLVRYAAKHGVSPQDIESMMPGWLDRLPTDHRNDQGRRLIDDAYRSIRVDMRQLDLSPSSVACAEITDELIRLKTIELGEWARFMEGGSDETRAKAAERRYMARLDSLLRIVARLPVRDETGAATPIVSTGLTRR